MSDELDTAAKIGGGALGGGGLLLLVLKRVFSNIDHYEKALASHREQIEVLKQKVVELDTRLRFREGGYGAEPLTNPGVRPTPQLEAYRAEMARRAQEEGAK